MEKSEILQLSKIANNVRQSIIKSVSSAKSGHPGGSLSIADLLTYLYFHEMKNIDVNNPKDDARDRLVLSKGHASPALYSILAEKGFFPKEELLKLRHLGALLQGHPDMKNINGVDMSTGSLGQGISAACGMALAAKVMQKKYRIYAILGDGELEEGQVWEAAMFASAKKLDNLIAIVDNNNLQIDGEISKVNSPYPIDEKFAAFGWYVINLDDAHNFEKLDAAFVKAKSYTGKPVVIIQKSIKGKGVDYMENNAAWHGQAPNEELTQSALEQLKAAAKALEE
ncbi:MAG: transketolase [Oscillospiraceae bacterium]